MQSLLPLVLGKALKKLNYPSNSEPTWCGLGPSPRINFKSVKSQSRGFVTFTQSIRRVILFSFKKKKKTKIIIECNNTRIYDYKGTTKKLLKKNYFKVEDTEILTIRFDPEDTMIAAGKAPQAPLATHRIHTHS